MCNENNLFLKIFHYLCDERNNEDKRFSKPHLLQWIVSCKQEGLFNVPCGKYMQPQIYTN